MFHLHDTGFRIVFSNGFALSVQWGPSHYRDNRSLNVAYNALHVWTSAHPARKVEVAILTPEGDFFNVSTRPEDFSQETLRAFPNDTVAGWQSVSDVLRIMNEVANLTEDYDG